MTAKLTTNRFRIVFTIVLAVILWGPSPAGAATEILNLAYGPNPRHRLDIYLPETRASSEKNSERAKTTVIFFHGGSWRRGSRERYKFVGRAIAELGYVAVLANYRLYPEVKFPAFVDDAARSVAWVRRNAARYKLGGKRLYLMGHSAGAHIAMLLALDPRYLKNAGVPRKSILGAIGLAGPYSFNPLRLARIRPIFADHPNPDEARPVVFARNVGPRLLLLHGSADRIVSARQSQDLANAYRAAGGKAALLIYEGVGHAGVVLALHERFSWRAPVAKALQKFIEGP
ncbi:MAG: alpha/beta hydrolase [Alphaproteobacteria bacterium]|nr:alpha/beta hydrolase [Alphaproteobacteria bacterium]